ncbi:hypothetical protein HDA32_000836 [Spinactinospora alkalitolerans]|uniref:Putative zinc-finger domain-containing protein n=1 Tax=Spinactinospora alkalitolerans TaxID=687207 RepID=A0A852TN19_9ACTN|nr:zf-HC2 domain-containing protein [Spinactinospora alkalitolerans]NYE45716.1 hypothetical protein [Spinactinospora alkalitolerans]
MNHLGERLSALVDGELGHADRDRALSHLAVCESCRFEAEMLRRLKRRLTGLGAPEPSTDFMGRLSALSASDSSSSPMDDPPFGPPPSAGAPRGLLSGLKRRGPSEGFGSMPPLGSSRPLGGGLPRVTSSDEGGAPPSPDARSSARTLFRDRADESASAAAPVRSRPLWGRARYAVAGASVAALTLGTAFVAGGEQEETPVVTPALADYAVEHALTTSHQAPVLAPFSVTAVGTTQAPGGDGDGRADVGTPTGDTAPAAASRPR